MTATFHESLAGFTDWLGYGHGERASRWAQRLELNEPELQAFRAAPECGAAPYQARAAALRAPDGIEVRDPALAADPQAAHERVRSAHELEAFTWIPETLERSGPGLLSGVPVVVKDLMAVSGIPLTGGSRAIDRAIATVDCEVVARLRRAGAVVVGLANLHELAYGITSDNPHFGRVVNPAAPDRIPGGSSGGSAAAVAAGVVELAVGTDTAGSIRVPAACCGIVGFKPGYDTLPRTGVIDLAPTLDHVGPMASTVPGCARMFAAMLGMSAMPHWRRASADGLRIARVGGYFETPLDAEVRAALDEAERALLADGASVWRAEIQGMELAAAIQLNTICAEASAVHAQRLAARGEDLGEDVRVRLEMGNFLPGHWYVRSQWLRSRLVEGIERAFDGCDLLLCATLRTPAPRVGAARVQIGERDYALHTAVTQLTMPFNLSGLPAISVPWSATSSGVPLCVQLVGPRGADWAVLSAAARLESLSPRNR